MGVSELGSFRRKLRVGVDIVEGQVAPHVAQVANIGEQLPHHLLRLPAVGTLAVAVLDERDLRCLGTANMVALDVDGGRSGCASPRPVHGGLSRGPGRPRPWVGERCERPLELLA